MAASRGSASAVLLMWSASLNLTNYEPVEQTVDRTTARSGVMIFLKRIAKSPFEKDAAVSVRDLKVPDKARREFEKGYQRLAKSDLDGGLKQLKKAVDVYPGYYDAYYQIGLADMHLTRWDDAESALHKAIELGDGRHAQPYLALGALYCQRKAFADAEGVLHRALEIEANSSQGYLFLGQAVYGLNRLDEAEKHAQAALARNSNEASAYLLLANVHIKKNNYALVQNDLDAYLKLKPTGPHSDQARATLAEMQQVLVGSR
jgi:tetratricopeptide (TPR) repeat protein